ncbi:protein DWARF 53-LIKE-like [Iris pallida]|uniref:Protein DWARF 53-LIKE-like n=1 Tax=Iris pallida TaxID=29817 RepID=A0AAX6H0U1_IRIPA|nr:protein DWARF 53-LIKE-like [Iris pallida]
MRKVDIVSTAKAKDDEKLLDTKIADLQKKWNDHCQRFHHGLVRLEANKCPVLPPIIGFPFISDRERVFHQNGLNPALTQSQLAIGTALPLTVGLQKISAASLSISLPLDSEPIDKDLISKVWYGVPKKVQIQMEGFQSYQSALSGLSTHSDRTSPSSVTSVATDLVLGTLHEPSHIMETAALSKRNECSNDLSQNSPIKKVNEFQRQLSSGSVVCQSSFQKLNTNNFKSFNRGLVEKVGRQEEAICAISSAILHCKSGHERRRGTSLKGDIWLSFHGPDRFGKKRAAAALAELVFGSREKLICIDLDYQEDFFRTNIICERREIQKCDGGFRGKTVADYIALEVSKKPLSVVFLENIEKADLLVQSSLSQAIRTGKIPGPHGREFSINNAIFLASTKTVRGKIPSPWKVGPRFTEEMILEAQGWQLRILVEPISETICRSPKFNVSISSMQESMNRQIVNKRKIDVSVHRRIEQLEQLGMKRAHKIPATLLDLNLPVDEAVEEETDCDSTNTFGRDELWVEDFLNLMDESVDFKPFDFDALADYVLKQISNRARDIIGLDCYLEIDVKVMQQILASAWLLEDTKDLNNWLDDVLCRSFIELRQRHSSKLLARTTLRLVAVEETIKEKYAPGVLLPSRIILD